MRGKYLGFKISSRRLGKLAVFGFFILAFGASLPFVEAKISQDKIARGVSIAYVDVGGKTKSEAEVFIQTLAEPLAQGIKTEFENNSATIGSAANFNEKKTIEEAFAIGRENGFLKNFLRRVAVRLAKKQVEPAWQINQKLFLDGVNSAFKEQLKPPSDAKFAVAFDKKGEFQIAAVAESAGFRLNEEQALNDLKIHLRDFSVAAIVLQKTTEEPSVKTSDLELFQPALETILKGPEPQIKWKEDNWTITHKDLSDWLEAAKNNDELKFVLNEEKVKTFLEGIAKKVDRLPQDAVLELDESGARATKFIPPSNGYQVYVKQNLEMLNQNLINDLLSEKKEISYELLTGETKPKIAAGETNQIGIKEIVGVGKTNFKGSPTNRVKNIKRGAQILNGLIIKPDEEFSLLEKLRPFTTENGYLRELVIKAAERKTVPEVGGGLCQIGTTAFRVALDAGVPITRRQNHFYRVSYYEPPVGMDATIYDPAPDFRFINDTGNNLLFITRVEGNNLTFELWGTRDNRKVEISKPEVYGISKPPAKKIIETLDLKPGQTKCTEKAHNGADAKFTYKVTYPDSRVEEVEFQSHYRPWQEVCLLGVEKLTEPAPEEPPATESQNNQNEINEMSDLEKLGTPIARD